MTIDFQPFLDAARLLYEGPWVAERYAAIRGFMEHQAAAMHPVTKSIIKAGAEFSAVSAFEASYRLAALKRIADGVWDQVEFIMTPTAGTIYRIAEIEIWSLTPEAFGTFVAAVPRPLCIGQVETEDGELVSGFLCESAGLENAQEITALGSWRSFVDGAGG